MDLQCLDLEAFRRIPLTGEPFEYLIVPEFVRRQARPGINSDYPHIGERGSFPSAQLAYGPCFTKFLEELESEEFRQAFEKKFGIELKGRPTTVTVRGRCDPRDGKIHTDSKSKIITVLIYMNPSWESSGGRLRLLRNGEDLEDMVAEVPPTEGTLVAFRRAENSWHGHKPFSGPRRVIQFNWVNSQSDRRIAMLRHHASAPFKRVFAMLTRKAAAPASLQ